MRRWLRMRGSVLGLLGVVVVALASLVTALAYT